MRRELLKERTRVGLGEVRKAGRVGRRPKLTQAQEHEVITLVTSGQKSAADAARLFRVHAAIVSRVLAQHRAQQLGKAPPPLTAGQEEEVRRQKNSSRKRTARNKAEKPGTKKSNISRLESIGAENSPRLASIEDYATVSASFARVEW